MLPNTQFESPQEENTSVSRREQKHEVTLGWGKRGHCFLLGLPGSVCSSHSLMEDELYHTCKAVYNRAVIIDT